ncbi:VgrG-related protein [Actinoplanes siamensis]|uniref:Type IV secretion protein Rhs n=1 Tax=Actinoplanes siamensis TaxID=1223317 RepID=A0A919TLH0_9ACTN|nr:VgrG-related protein [Actinoplanes siamensis]GIF07191.1 type IV secretion protein Rhs [Actinoplanes siamensis]
MGAGTDHVNNLQLGLPGQLPRKWERRLVSATVEDSSNLAAVAELRFRDEHGVFYAENGVAIGSKVTVRVRRGRTTSVLLFKGEVVTLESQHDGYGTFSVIRALDLSHRLMRGQRVRSFVKQTPTVIAQRLAGAAGLPIGKIDSFTRSYDMITQPNVSDWEFLKMLAVDNEAEVAVVDGKFYFRASERASTAPGTGLTAEQSPKVIEAGNNVLAVRSTVTSVGQVPAVTVRGWDPVQKKSVKTRLQVTDSAELDIKTTPRKAIQPFGAGGAGLNVTDVPYETEAETRVVARAVAADVTAALAELEVGVRGRPELRAGVPMTLKKIGAEFDGKYTITSSRHVFAPGSVYETWVTVSGRQDRSMYGLAGGTGAPARPVRVPGMAIGIVTDTKVDADPRQSGRAAGRKNQGWVRLRFPWLTDDAEYQTDWVRTVQLGGVGGGGVFTPEINDEVLVGFEQGLLDRPYVIGGLYNGKDNPSPHQTDLIDGTTGKVNRRSFANRADDRIELLDSRLNPKGIRLATAKDKLVVFLDRGSKKIVVHADGKIEIDATGSVEVRGNGITLDAGRGDLTLKGRRISVTGAVEADVRAPIVRLN